MHKLPILFLLVASMCCEAEEKAPVVSAATGPQLGLVNRDCFLCHDARSFGGYSRKSLIDTLILLRDNDPKRLSMMSKVLFGLTDPELEGIAKLLVQH